MLLPTGLITVERDSKRQARELVAERPVRAPQRDVSPHSRDDNGGPVLRALAWTWLAFFAAIVVTAPEPTGQDQWWVAPVGALFLIVYGAAVALLFRARVIGLTASLVAAAIGSAIAAHCIASHHHPAGLWTSFQLGGFLGLTAMSIGARVLTRGR